MRRGLEFALKGERAYVQGPDMVEAAMREALGAAPPASAANLVFVMHRLTGQNLEMIVDEEAPAGAAPVAHFRFEADAAPRRGVLVERADRPAGRRPYDEAPLRERCRVDADAKVIALQGVSPLMPLETLVAMTKALHQAVYPPRPGQWLFVRLDAPRWPLEAAEGAEVRLESGVGTRLTKSSAHRGGGALTAWIYFSFREPA